MVSPHVQPAHGVPRPHDWNRTLRVALTAPAMRLLARGAATLALLIVVGVVTGQLLGLLAAGGIEQLLDLVADR